MLQGCVVFVDGIVMPGEVGMKARGGRRGFLEVGGQGWHLIG